MTSSDAAQDLTLDQSILSSEFLRAAAHLIRQTEQPMTARELVDEGRAAGLFTDRVAGKTPHQTMKSKLSVHIRRYGNTSVFVRTGPGRFFLRSLLAPGQKEYPSKKLIRSAEPSSVLIFPRDALVAADRFQGLRRSSGVRLVKHILRSDECAYLQRFHAEQTDDHKQVLTYILVRKGPLILAYRRGTYNRVEDFLKGSLCIGFGGHVTAEDSHLFSAGYHGLFDCAIRELNEELSLPPVDRKRLSRGIGLSLVGAINDDSSVVGRRHFAAVFEYRVSTDPRWDTPRRGEKSITQLRWLRPADEQLWDFEYWSQLCLRAYFAKAVRPAATFRIARRRFLEPPSVLVVTGEVGSGKTETSRILHREFGYHEIDSGKVLAGLLQIPPVPQTPRRRFQQAAWEFVRSTDGTARLASAIANAITAESRRVVVNGVRQLSTFDQLSALIAPRRTGLVYVITPADLRFAFLRRREGLTQSEYIAVQESPVESDVRRFLQRSSAVVYNWRGLAQLQGAVRQLIRGVLVTR